MSVGTLRKSLSRILPDGTTLYFPTLDDLVDLLVEEGHIKSKQDLLENHPDLISEMFYAWVASGQLACQYAVKLASQPRDSGLISNVVFGALAHDDINDPLSSFLLASARESEAVQIIFPDIDSPQDVVRLINCLCHDPSWRCEEIPWEGGKAETLLLGLRWLLPGREYMSWALGFAPFDSMPFTRRAPFTAIVMRVRGPGKCEAVMGFDTRPETDGWKAVHLADVPTQLPDDDVILKYLRLTQHRRDDLLGGELCAAARAKVAFSLPLDFREQVDGLKKI